MQSFILTYSRHIKRELLIALESQRWVLSSNVKGFILDMRHAKSDITLTVDAEIGVEDSYSLKQIQTV